MSREKLGEQKLEEQTLDALLNDWSARHALRLNQAETIRRAIMLTPTSSAPELSVAWWHQMFGRLSIAVERATDMSRYLRYKPVL